MSEAEDGERVAGRTDVWIEKYRPDRLADVKGHDEIIPRLQSYVDQDDLSHLMFAGPAGTGKCVTGETPVLTSNGLEEIETVVGDVEGFGEPDPETEILTFDDRSGEFEYTEPSRVFAKRAERTVEVATRDGADIQATPEHKLLLATEDGLEWRRAENLQPGDRVVRPLQLPESDETSRIDWHERLDGDRTYVTVSEEFAEEHSIPAEQQYVGEKRRVFGLIRTGHGVEDLIEEDVDPATAEKYAREASDVDLEGVSRTCSLSYLRSLDVDRDTLREHVESIQYVSENGQTSTPITPPWELTPDLGAFLGLLVGEARIDGGRIRFYSTEDQLLDRFESVLVDRFDLNPTHMERKGVPMRRVISRTLTHYLRSVFAFVGDSSDDDPIASRMLRAPEETKSAFLRALFDAEGHVTDNGIVELVQKDGDLITLVSYLLADFGIPSRRKTERKSATNGSGTEREYHVLYLSSAPHLETFQRRIGFGLERKASRVADRAAVDSNPNHDTMPTQRAVDTLVDELRLKKGEHCRESLDPDNPGRENYEETLESVLEAATEKIETVQRVLTQLCRLEEQIDTVTATPATWAASRAELTPLATRKAVADDTGVAPGRLLEHADGRRTPYAERVDALLVELDERDARTNAADVASILNEAVERLDVSYETVASGTPHRGVDVANLLGKDGYELATLTRFETVRERLRSIAAEMCSEEVLEALSTLQSFVDGELYFDEVTEVSECGEPTRVYDLTVPDTHNFVGGNVPTVMHNTASSVAIAKEMYGDDWQENFLELNASDQRGIDVVRDRIKDFARSSFGGYSYRIIFLDEADALCVPPGTEVVTGYPSSPEVKPIESVSDDGEPIPSVDFETNEIQSDKGRLVDSGVADFFELELEDGRTILASLTHPFFVVGEDGELVEKELRDLTPGDEIADFKDEVGVTQCDICGGWTHGRFCSIECKDEGHSREMQGEGNPMYGTEWSDERREKIVEKLSDGRFAGENNPNYEGEFYGTPVWEMDEEAVEQFRETISELRSGTSWEEWTVDADPETVKEKIGIASSEWWDSLDDDEKARIVEKSTENCDYPVCDISGDNNPMRDPEIAQKVSEALMGHEPTGGNIRYSDELGHLVRSDWEYEIAKALQDAGVEYEYEPEFELSDSVFHPDFLIDDTVVEVKGVAKLWGQTEKVEEFLDTYGDEYRFVVVGDGNLPHHEHYERGDFEPAIVSDGGRQAVQTVEVRSVEYSHRGEAYNISMEGTPNFMLANGILTHNTSDAQSALRRTMEQFSNNTRFILSCNYSSQIIDPIQSRCTVFRFSPLSDDAVAEQVREIATTEGIEVTDDGIEALVYVADGDMRAAINGLQAASVMGDVVDEETVYTINAAARPEEVEAIVTKALAGEFVEARALLDELLTDRGIAGGDVIDQIHRSIWEFDLDDEAAVRVMDRVGEADYRITTGANERIQLEALLAALAREE